MVYLYYFFLSSQFLIFLISIVYKLDMSTVSLYIIEKNKIALF